VEKTFSEILLELGIDFSKTILQKLGGGSATANSELSPKDFIRFSKQDFSEKNKKGLINSLTNVKGVLIARLILLLRSLALKQTK
jgi:hypothetical protein